jgi:hypothetical protein
MRTSPEPSVRGVEDQATHDDHGERDRNESVGDIGVVHDHVLHQRLDAVTALLVLTGIASIDDATISRAAIPPAGEVAAVLGVNTNTVLRPLRNLRAEGLLEFGRGRGATVVGTSEHGLVVTKTKDLLQLACQHG